MEKPVITDQLFKSTNLCSERSGFKEAWAQVAADTRQVMLAVTQGTLCRASGMTENNSPPFSARPMPLG